MFENFCVFCLSISVNLVHIIPMSSGIKFSRSSWIFVLIVTFFSCLVVFLYLFFNLRILLWNMVYTFRDTFIPEYVMMSYSINFTWYVVRSFKFTYSVLHFRKILYDYTSPNTFFPYYCFFLLQGHKHF